MEFKGTKEKWICIGGTEHKTSRIIIGNAHDIELEINGKDRIEEEVANALLISKAPEMLEMLIEIESKLGDFFHKEKEEIKQLIKEATEL
jgi:hypothetical protein